MKQNQREKKIDSRYFRILNKSLSGLPNLFAALRPVNYEKEKKKFFINSGSPIFKYKLLAKNERQKRKKLLFNLAQILEKEKNLSLKKLYQDKIGELLAQLDYRYYVGRSPKKFFAASVKLFGRPKSTDLKSSIRDFEEQKKMEAINQEKAKERKIFNALEIKEVFNQAIKMLKIKNWQAVVEARAKNIGLNPKNKKGCCLEIPLDKELDFYALEALINHEIATHLSRNISGESSPLCLLSFLGADHYHAIEEGLALYAEQVSYKRRGLLPKKATPLTSLAIGAAVEGRNFKETYKFLLNLEINSDRAWHHTFRVFRGVSNTSKSFGYVDTSGCRYRQGNLEVIKFIKKNGVRALDKLWVGKIGIKHLPLMEKLGITQPAVERRYLNLDDLMN